jgi:hypothetical protein
MTTIRDTALQLAADVDQWLKAGNSVGTLSEHAVAGLADTFERAILAERERCATVLEGWGLLNGAKVLRDAALAAPPVGGP